ncbi:ComF family protein [Thiovibrio frasassiensis]|uniref:ComF family protein n=1 Tax=Thiovibrio frasassiensis TaxID=2984131 RepID=A0A9X4MFW5_9BACT|nr:ComF family protein [Thiovibrio frasassiensis]MDG4475500.1 ComF family protein [Thiovibrio frasassiensis]
MTQVRNRNSRSYQATAVALAAFCHCGKRFFQSLLDLLLPSFCLACTKPLGFSPELLFCPDCLGKIHVIQSPLCPCCGRTFLVAAGPDHHCGHCLMPQLAAVAGADWIVPVPLHPKRLRERGFNQALLLARAFFPKDRRITHDLLVRTRVTEPQTRFNGKARRTNLKNAFGVVKPQHIPGKKILLIDDVFTTGTTVNECARVLKKAGAADVMVLTLARVKEDY